jgi:hypothetical protein
MLHQLGISGHGNPNLNGVICNIRREGDLLVWDHYNPPEVEPNYVVICDGEVVGSNPDKETGLLTDFESVKIEFGYPQRFDYHGDFAGSRGYLRWEPSTSEDCVGYRIRYATHFVADIYDIKVYPHPIAFGDYDGPPINKEFSINISGNTFTTDFFPGKTFNIADRVYIRNGVFFDFKNRDINQNVYTFRIGPKNNFLTGKLEDGSYIYTVSALDAAGNESTGTSSSFTIHQRPSYNDVFEYINFEYDFVLEVEWEFKPNPNIDGFRIYTNYSHIFGKLVDNANILYVDLSMNDISQTNLLQIPLLFTPPSEPSIWKIFLKPYNAAGEAFSPLIIIDKRGNGTQIFFSEIANVKTTLLPMGSFKIEWKYDHTDGSSADRFFVFVANSESALDTMLNNNSPTATIMATASDGIESYTYTHTSGSGTKWFAIRSANATKNDKNMKKYSIVVDNVPPSPPPYLMGIPQ